MRTIAWETDSLIALRNCSEEIGKEPVYIFSWEIHVVKHTSWLRLLLITKKQTSQVNFLSVFLCMGRCKNLGSLRFFLGCAPQLSGASTLYFHILSFLRAQCRKWLQSDGCDMADILFSPEFPQGSPAHVGGLQSLMTVTSFVY